ncbi:MAG: endonuclease domain-containing protein [Mucilaginibacter sp.]
MSTAEHNLKRFCAIKGIDVIRSREVNHGTQYTLGLNSQIVHITLFPHNNLVQGSNGDLKEMIMAWGDKSPKPGEGWYADLPSGWREWNENARWLKDFHDKYGVPKEEDMNHRYMINREILFHDYMFRQHTFSSLPFEMVEKLVRAWFHRNCFMNLDVDAIISTVKIEIEKEEYLELTVKNVTFAGLTDILAQIFPSVCPKKYACIGGKCNCPQTESDHSDCFVDLVDALFPYFSNSMLSYTKGNLHKLVDRDGDLKWKNLSPSTPIEQIMSDKLIDAGILSIPQYQAWDAEHRYSIDFAIKTPQGLNIAIECDGLQFHAKPSAYIHDRKRDRYLQNNGFYVMRFSSVEIYNEIGNVIEEIDKSFWKIQKKQLDIRTPYRISYFGYGEDD